MNTELAILLVTCLTHGVGVGGRGGGGWGRVGLGGGGQLKVRG